MIRLAGASDSRNGYRITLNGRAVVCREDQAVLDALLDAGLDVPYGCRQGACQSCLMRSDTEPPPFAQQGLRDVERRQNYFLPCICYPERDMAVSLGHEAGGFVRATVVEKQALNADTVLLALECRKPLQYYAGQFVNLRRADGLARSYSIANSRTQRRRLTFHIRRLAGGRFSEWVHGELQIGDTVEVSAPQGLCYYLPEDLRRNLLLIGTGSGLAPLAGIIEEALEAGHGGDIHLFHGSRTADGLYLVEEMRRLAARHRQFHYTPCVSGGAPPDGMAGGRAHDVAMAALPGLKDWSIYLCGHPDMVHQSKRQVFLKGAALQDIHADAFHVGPGR